MPEVGFSHVVSCSSQDPSFPAANLLEDGFKKWKSSKAGESQLSVELQLRESCKISSVHVGNEGSAFIEVEAGRSTEPDKFTTLISAVAFMSPTESRANLQPNRVRLFNASHLNPAAASQQWDRIRLVCTQPFSKTTQYGLAFVRVITSEPLKTQQPTEKPKITLTPVKNSEGGGSTFVPGSLFARRKIDDGQQKATKVSVPFADMAKARNAKFSVRPDGDTPPSTSATRSPQIMNSTNIPASTSADKAVSKRHQDRHVKNGDTPKRARDRDCSPREETRKKRLIDPEDDDLPTRGIKPVPAGNRELKVATNTPPLNPAGGTKRDGEKTNKAPKLDRNVKKKRYVEYSKLLGDVTIVLSGFQNPLRGQLRDKAIAMGARYAADWSPRATHLIAAFSNTPKVNAVKASGRGRIVKSNWLDECDARRMKLPWRNFALLNEDHDEPDSEDEILVAKPAPLRQSIFDLPTDSESSDDDHSELFSDPETGLPVLPDFLEGETIFIDPALQGVVIKALERYAVAFGGKISPYMDDSVSLLLTDAYRAEMSAISHGVKLLKLDWLMECGRSGVNLDQAPFEILRD